MNIKGLAELLRRADNVDEINRYKEEISQLIPEVAIMFDYDQKNKYHQYDLWMHSIHVVVNLPDYIDDDMLYIAALLHDIGKPESQCHGRKPEDTQMHYYGHAIVSEKIVKDRILPMLYNAGERLTENDIDRLLYYVRRHDDTVSINDSYLYKTIKNVSKEIFINLLYLQMADAKAHVKFPVLEEKYDLCEKIIKKINGIDNGNGFT